MLKIVIFGVHRLRGLARSDEHESLFMDIQEKFYNMPLFLPLFFTMWPWSNPTLSQYNTWSGTRPNLQSWVPKIGWENDPMQFRRKRQFAATPLRPTFGSPYHSSKTLNHGGPLNVIITEWFDTNSNETHCWIKCKKIKNEKKALKNSYKMVSFGSTIDGVRMIRCAPIEIFLTRGGIPGDPTPRWFLHCAPQGRPQIAICARPYWILYNIYIHIYRATQP